jgi:hypothetical protein
MALAAALPMTSAPGDENAIESVAEDPAERQKSEILEKVKDDNLKKEPSMVFGEMMWMR